MQRGKGAGLRLLAVWLLLTGLLPFLRVDLPYRATLLPLLALAAGVLLLLGR